MAAAATPVVAGRMLPTDDTTARCAAFLALSAEIGRLALRWSRLESRMVREGHRSEAERQVREMTRIDTRIEALCRRRDRMLPLIADAMATSVGGVAAKLAVAVELVQPDDDRTTHRLLDGALRDLRRLACPG